MGAKLERQSEADVTANSTVTVIEPAEAERAIATIVLAFSADPATRWTYPDPHQYLGHFPAIRACPEPV
jgi:hypothetical protein